MPKFKVVKGQDAYVLYSTIVEAETKSAANEKAAVDHFKLEWEQMEETNEFDDFTFLPDLTEEITDETE